MCSLPSSKQPPSCLQIFQTGTCVYNADFTPEIVLQVPVSSFVAGNMLRNALKIVPDDSLNIMLDTNSTEGIITPRQKIAAEKTGVDGWRLVRFLPPTSATWYSGDDDLAGIRTENAYNFSKEWLVPFGEFDEFCFSTFNFNNWLYTTKDAAIGWKYGFQPRTVLKSSISQTSYTASWNNRANILEDPWIGLKNHGVQGDFIFYAENSYEKHSSGASHFSMPSIASDGGMCVWVRNSKDSIIVPRQKIAAEKTGVDGWRMVRFLPPTSTSWYSGNDNLEGIRTENAYDFSKEG